MTIWSGSAPEVLQLCASSYLSVGCGEQSQQQISEWHRVYEPLDPLDGRALSHDIQHCWRAITLPALEDTISN